MVICMEHKCHSSLKPSDFLLSVVYNSDTGEKVGDFHVSFKDPKRDKRFHEIKFNDTKDKTNVSNAIVSLANSLRSIVRSCDLLNLNMSVHKYNLSLIVVQ
jgi:hypothetical protein